jgi:hypothetical protein
LDPLDHQGLAAGTWTLAGAAVARPHLGRSALAERGADELADGGGIAALEVVAGDQRGMGAHDGTWWQRQDLEAGTVEGDEILVDERVAQMRS